MRKVKRITGTTLQNIREAHFSQEPFCVMCKARGLVTEATELDHIQPLHQGGTDTHDNRQGLCHECHAEKSKIERGHQYHQKAVIGVDGWPK